MKLLNKTSAIGVTIIKNHLIVRPKYSACMAGWDPNEKWGGGGVVGSGYWAFQLAQMTPVLKHLVCEWIALCGILFLGPILAQLTYF